MHQKVSCCFLYITSAGPLQIENQPRGQRNEKYIISDVFSHQTQTVRKLLQHNNANIMICKPHLILAHCRISAVELILLWAQNLVSWTKLAYTCTTCCSGKINFFRSCFVEPICEMWMFQPPDCRCQLFNRMEWDATTKHLLWHLKPPLRLLVSPQPRLRPHPPLTTLLPHCLHYPQLPPCISVVVGTQVLCSSLCVTMHACVDADSVTHICGVTFSK